MAAAMVHGAYWGAGGLDSKEGVRRSDEYKSLMKTEWMTLSSASLAVLSSTALYVNALMFMALGESGNQWYASPYLNIGIFWINLDSVLNDIGILLACGVLKTASCATLTKYFSTTANYTVAPIAQVMGFVPNNQASSIYVPNEVDASS
jgi:hypothetical protein